MSNLRIAGLASGMDTDAMVQSLMKVERLKVDRYEQSKQIALWRQEAYNSMNKMFANFILNSRKDMGLARTSSTGFLSNNSYTRIDYLRKATSSNENVATVSTTSEAVNGSYTIQVKELANGASFSSAKIEKVDDKEKTFGTELSFKLGTGMKDADGKEIIKTITVENENGVTMNDVAKKISSAKIETYEGKLVTDGKIEINNQMVTLTEEQKKQVKEVSLGVNAFYDEDNGRLFMQTTETGKDIKINLQAIDGNIASKNFVTEIGYVGINEDLYVGGDGAKYNAGKDAEIIFNGVNLTYSSNNINLNGLNVELKAKDTTTIKVDTNIDGIMEKIEKLVNDYNELVDKASDALNEKRYAQYHPLSQEEKKAMHEDDVKLWTEKAKSGMLNRDQTIQRALWTARNDIYKTVEGAKGSFNHITQIGITTEKYVKGTAGGKLQIDKDRLREAIEKDPEGVMELLFTEPKALEGRPPKPEQKEGETDAEYAEILKQYEKDLRDYEIKNKKYRNDNGGIFTRIYDNFIDGMKSIIDKSGPGEDAELFRSVKSNILIDFVTEKSSISDLDKEVLNTSRKIDDLNEMLVRKENAYYAKFANMEKMLQQMYSQGNWLTQQFAR